MLYSWKIFILPAHYIIPCDLISPTWLDRYKAEIIWFNTFLEFLNLVYITLYMTKLFSFILNIPYRANFRAVSRGYKVGPFTLLYKFFNYLNYTKKILFNNYLI